MSNQTQKRVKKKTEREKEKERVKAFSQSHPPSLRWSLQFSAQRMHRGEKNAREKKT